MNLETYLVRLGDFTDQKALTAFFIEQAELFGAAAVVGFPPIYGHPERDGDNGAYVSTFPKHIREFYKRFAAVNDPFMEAAFVRGGPVQYSRIRDELQWSPVQLEYFRLLDAAGMKDGVGTPVSPKPGVLAYFAMTFYEERPEMTWAQLREIYVFFNEFFARYWEIRDRSDYGISSRERQILVGIMKGKSKAEISETLGLSLHTIDTYTRRCFEKLKVKNRTEAAVKAFGLGLAFSETSEEDAY